jgi:hypothetical protein
LKLAFDNLLYEFHAS